MTKQSELEKIKKDLKGVVDAIEELFGAGYPCKNPGLIQHLMDKIQQEEDRSLTRTISNIPIV